MLLPAVVLVLIYAYGPLVGMVMAFQNFQPLRGFFRSKFVGLDNFRYILQLPDFYNVLGNTLYISVYKLILRIFVPLILALTLNEIRVKWFAKATKSIIFLPYFLSWVVLGGVISELFYFGGPINHIVKMFGHEPIMFLASNEWFPWIIILTDVWKDMGYNMIIYLAAITAIDPTMYEAAEIDGAGIFQRMAHITLPNIMPIVVLLATLSLGNILNAGFDQVQMLINPIVYESGDIIDTLVYRIGIFNYQYSHAATIGLFKSLVSFTLVVISYSVAYKAFDYRIF
ncbi:MAG: ABC transporter permease subunit [Clostridia bacterium]